MMSLRDALVHVLQSYPNATEESFAQHPMANFLRSDLRKIVKELVEGQQYLFKGSAGNGQWTYVPWVAILDSMITISPQEGYYLVYLFREDGSGVYLSLNQGVKLLQRKFGAGAREVLCLQADEFAVRLEQEITRLKQKREGCVIRQIELVSARRGSIDPKLYEEGAICSLLYEKDNIPSDEVLQEDLQQMLRLYTAMTQKDPDLESGITQEDEDGLEQEDLRKFRIHKRVDRNRRLAEKVKKLHHYTCAACKFNFRKTYGEIGSRYIEAHHLQPISSLLGTITKLNPKTDFAVLCSNCHRMIHRSEYVSDVEAFRKKYVLKVT